MSPSPDVQVLVVEDDPLLARAHAEYTDRVAGFRTAAVVGTGAAAVAALRRGEVDLVLLDVFLPDTTGLELCRELRRAGLPVDVIAVTSARDVGVVQQSVSLGVLQYLVKPFTFAVFRQTLERYSAYRSELLAQRDLDGASQQDVDRLLGTLRAPGRAATPKGFASETYELVVHHLRRAPAPSSATDVADSVGVSRVTARRYLEHLVREGLADRSLRHGHAGRPEQLYRWVGRS